MTKKRSSRKTSRQEKETMATWLTGGSEEDEQGYKTAYITLQNIPQSKIPKEGSQYEYSCNPTETMERQAETGENINRSAKIKTTGTVITSQIPDEVEEVSFKDTEEFSKVSLPEKKPDTTIVYFAKLVPSNEYIFRIDTEEEPKVYTLGKNTCGVKIKYGTTNLEIKQFDWTEKNTAAENEAEEAKSAQLLAAEQEIEDLKKEEEKRREEANAKIQDDKEKINAEATARTEAIEANRKANEERIAKALENQKNKYKLLETTLENRQAKNASKTAARQEKEEQRLAAEEAKKAANVEKAKMAQNAANAEKAEEEERQKAMAEKLAALNAERQARFAKNLANNVARQKSQEQQLKALNEEQQNLLKQIEAERQRQEGLKKEEQTPVETTEPAKLETITTPEVPRPTNEEINATAAKKAAQNVAEAKKAANEQIRLEEAEKQKKEAEKAAETTKPEEPQTPAPENQSVVRSTIASALQANLLKDIKAAPEKPQISFSVDKHFNITCTLQSNNNKDACMLRKFDGKTLQTFKTQEKQNWAITNEATFTKAELPKPSGDEYKDACFVYFAKTGDKKISARIVDDPENKIFEFDITSGRVVKSNIPIPDTCIKNKKVYLIAYNPPATVEKKSIVDNPVIPEQQILNESATGQQPFGNTNSENMGGNPQGNNPKKLMPSQNFLSYGMRSNNNMKPNMLYPAENLYAPQAQATKQQAPATKQQAPATKQQAPATTRQAPATTRQATATKQQATAPTRQAPAKPQKATATKPEKPEIKSNQGDAMDTSISYTIKKTTRTKKDDTTEEGYLLSYAPSVGFTEPLNTRQYTIFMPLENIQSLSMDEMKSIWENFLGEPTEAPKTKKPSVNWKNLGCIFAIYKLTGTTEYYIFNKHSYTKNSTNPKNKIFNPTKIEDKGSKIDSSGCGYNHKLISLTLDQLNKNSHSITNYLNTAQRAQIVKGHLNDELKKHIKLVPKDQYNPAQAGGSATIKTQTRRKTKPGTLKRSKTMKTRKYRNPKKTGIQPGTQKRI